MNYFNFFAEIVFPLAISDAEETGEAYGDYESEDDVMFVNDETDGIEIDDRLKYAFLADSESEESPVKSDKKKGIISTSPSKMRRSERKCRFADRRRTKPVKISPPKICHTSKVQLQSIIMSNVHPRILQFEAQRKKEVVMLADSHGRNAKDIFNSFLPKELFNVRVMFKPSAFYAEVLSDVDFISRGLTRQDYFIIMAGTNDLLANSPLHESTLRATLDNLKHTNTFFVGVPYWYGKAEHNENVAQFNFMADKVIEDYDYVMYVETSYIFSRSEMTKHGLHMNFNGKKALYGFIAKQILISKRLGKFKHKVILGRYSV